jgi:hypothetical protein
LTGGQAYPAASPLRTIIDRGERVANTPRRSAFFIERVGVRMTASDFCAAREVISCQPGAIHIRGDASSSHVWAAQPALVAVRGARAAAAESGRARAHQNVIKEIRFESRMRRARRPPRRVVGDPVLADPGWSRAVRDPLPCAVSLGTAARHLRMPREEYPSPCLHHEPHRLTQ